MKQYTLSEKQLEEIVVRTLNEINLEGLKGNFKNKMRDFGSKMDNFLSDGEWVNPDSITNELARFSFDMGWVLKKMEGDENDIAGTYKVRTKDTTNGRSLTHKDIYMKRLSQKFPNYNFESSLDPNEKSYMGIDRDENGRIDYVYNIFNQVFILKVTPKMNETRQIVLSRKQLKMLEAYSSLPAYASSDELSSNFNNTDKQNNMPYRAVNSDNTKTGNTITLGASEVNNMDNPTREAINNAKDTIIDPTMENVEVYTKQQFTSLINEEYNAFKKRLSEKYHQNKRK